MNNLFRNDSFVKIFSFLIAIVIWVLIIGVENPDITVTVSNIPVKYLEYPVFQEAGLAIVDYKTNYAQVQIKGKRNVVARLDNTNVTASVNLKQVTEKGTAYLPVSVSFPTNVSVSLADVRPYNLKLEIDDLVQTVKDISVLYTGKPKNGYIALTPQVIPENIILSGPRSVVEKISTVEAAVDLSGQDTIIEGEYKYKLLDASGSIIEDGGIFGEVDYIDIITPVYKVKTVSLNYQVTGALPDETLSLINAVITPDTIKIASESTQLDGINEILLEPVDLKKLTGTTELILKPVLPENVFLAEEAQDIKVVFNIALSEVKTINVSNIIFENLTEGYKAEVAEPNGIDIRVRGEKDIISGVTASDISVTADVNRITEGINNIKLKVVSNGKNIEVLGEYNVDIDISKAG